MFQLKAEIAQGEPHILEFESEADAQAWVRHCKQVGMLSDVNENVWKYVNADKSGKSELYCEALHASIPLFPREQKPIDPLAKFK